MGLDKLEALENDVKEIYGMLKDANIPADDSSSDYDVKAKLLELNKQLIVAANHAGVALPR